MGGGTGIKTNEMKKGETILDLKSSYESIANKFEVTGKTFEKFTKDVSELAILMALLYDNFEELKQADVSTELIKTEHNTATTTYHRLIIFSLVIIIIVLLFLI